MKAIFIFLFSLFSLQLIAQEASVSIATQESWPPGKNVPVTVEIIPGNAEGFARFFHDLPQGFTVENVVNGGADFFQDNNQINYVWLDLPDEEVIVIQYLARADKLLAGSFNISGRLDYILDDTKKISVLAEPVYIKLDREAEVESVAFPDEVVLINKEEDIEEAKIEADPQEEEIEAVKDDIPAIDFRVQVTISSQRVSQEELENRIGSKLKHGITVLRTGNMYKYQSGSFKEYSEASVYLNELKTEGVSDAFIVAFSNNNQISISEARSISEK